MNTSIAEGILLAKQINFLTKELETEVEVIIAPPYTHLAGIASLLKRRLPGYHYQLKIAQISYRVHIQVRFLSKCLKMLDVNML